MAYTPQTNRANISINWTHFTFANVTSMQSKCFKISEKYSYFLAVCLNLLSVMKSNSKSVTPVNLYFSLYIRFECNTKSRAADIILPRKMKSTVTLTYNSLSKLGKH